MSTFFLSIVGAAAVQTLLENFVSAARKCGVAKPT